jgi:hypothetical protein
MWLFSYESYSEKPNMFFGYTKYTKETITNDRVSLEIEYDDSKFSRYDFSANLYDDIDFGLTFDQGEETKKIAKYSGYLTTKSWIYSFEQGKYSGRIKWNNDNYDPHNGTIEDEFETNNYQHITILKSSHNSIDTNIFGFYYKKYDLATIGYIDGKHTYDTNTEIESYGIVWGYDTPKSKLMHGFKGNDNDWFFHIIDYMGYSTATLSDNTYQVSTGLIDNIINGVNYISYGYNNKVKGKPDKSSWSNIGMSMEYGFGYVRYQKIGGAQLALKVGYYGLFDAPLMDSDSTVNILLQHYPKFDLYMTW